MQLQLQGEDQRLVCLVIGEVKAEDSGQLREAVIGAAASKPREIVLDLSQTTYIDSTGLGTLVGLRVHLKKYGTAFTLRSPRPRVMQTLRLTQLSRLFGMEGTNP